MNINAIRNLWSGVGGKKKTHSGFSFKVDKTSMQNSSGINRHSIKYRVDFHIYAKFGKLIALYLNIFCTTYISKTSSYTIFCFFTTVAKGIF